MIRNFKLKIEKKNQMELLYCLMNNREVEQTQLVRVRVRVTSLFVDDVILICVPRTCASSYTFA